MCNFQKSCKNVIKRCHGEALKKVWLTKTTYTLLCLKHTSRLNKVAKSIGWKIVIEPNNVFAK